MIRLSIHYLHDSEGRIIRQEDGARSAEWTVMKGLKFLQPCAVVVALNKAIQSGLEGQDDRAYMASLVSDEPKVLVQWRSGRTDRVPISDLNVRQAQLLAVELGAAFAIGQHMPEEGKR
ncbi:hypothetical protein [Nonomuraea basaltis]|uniref:hypothetical protein n=1 Tax=Nonomuraea basaltis TaxID=2495887 RepID=UPI00110C54C0|nr:hypothetical protein [Nonomuraea basaltis]TMR91310.1 hypothetical protein EJK15_50870 [Nonomuraea basaltis]